MLGVAEFEESRGPFVLFLLPMQIHTWDVYVVQQLAVKLDSITRRKKKL